MNHAGLGLLLLSWNLFELNYYPLMISLEKYNYSYNAVDDLTTKICIPSKTKT